MQKCITVILCVIPIFMKHKLYMFSEFVHTCDEKSYHNNCSYRFLSQLQKLLPKGCCRVIYYSKEYEDSWKCNFLGLPPGTVLPPHATMYVVLDIIEPEEASTQTNFSNYMFCLETPMQMPEKGMLLHISIDLQLQRIYTSWMHAIGSCRLTGSVGKQLKVRILFTDVQNVYASTS